MEESTEKPWRREKEALPPLLAFYLKGENNPYYVFPILVFERVDGQKDLQSYPLICAP